MFDLVQVFLLELSRVCRKAVRVEPILFRVLPSTVNDRVPKVLYCQVIVEDLPIDRDSRVGKGLIEALDTLAVFFLPSEVFFENHEPVAMTPRFEHRLDSADDKDHKDAAE